MSASGETKEEYEARFVAWVERLYDCSVCNLDPRDERYYRMRFATQNARGVVRFHARDFDADQAYRPREQTSRRRSRSSERHGTSDSRERTQRSRSRSRSRDGSDHRPRPPRDRQSSSPPRKREAYYAKKYVELDHYMLDFKQNRIAAYSMLTDAEKLELFGSTIVPIHVPLARSESMRQYEERFVKWLESTQGYTLRDLEAHDDERFERYYRIKFANLNATGEVQFDPHDAERDRSCNVNSPRPSKKPALGEDKPPHAATEGSRRECVSEKVSPSASSVPSREGSSSVLHDSERALAVAAAYVVCGCRECLVTGMRFLNTKTADLNGSTCETCHANASIVAKDKDDVVSLTQDEVPQSPKTTTTKDASLFAAAVTKLVTAKSTTGKLEQLIQVKPRNKDDISIADDAVERQLVAEYTILNQAVMKKEKALANLTDQLAQTPTTTNTTETMRLQEGIEKLGEEIEQEAKNRSAAVAMVIGHMWCHKRDDLERRVGNPQNKNDLVIQRTSHEKCSTLTTAVEESRHVIATIKRQVDGAVAATASTATFDSHAALLSQLSHTLTKAERELRSLLLQRRHEFARLVEVDELLRLHLHMLVQRSRECATGFH